MAMNKNAKWVWLAGDELVNSYVLFRQECALEEARELTLRVSADSQYVAYWNGEAAGFGQYADYPAYKVYDEVTLSGKVGRNVLEIAAYCQGEDGSTYRLGRRGVIFDIEGVMHSGEDTLCARHPNYASGPVEKISHQLSFSFRYDETAGEPVWTRPETRENEAALCPRPVKKLVLAAPEAARVVSRGVFKDSENAQTSGERAYGAYLKHLPSCTRSLPARVEREADAGGVYLLADVGREKAGVVSFELDAPKGALVDVSFGEHLDDLRPRAAVGGRNFAFSYVSGGRRAFTHYFKRLAGRYLQFHVHGDWMTLYAADIRSCDYPLSPRPAPRGLDRLEKMIYDTCLDTLKLCMHEHYEDCPWREQALYAMDSRNQMLCGYYAFGEYEFARASLRLLALGLREDGLLELCAPARVSITIPSFSLMWVVALREYGAYSGDWAFVKEMLPAARRVMAACEARMGARGLIRRFEGAQYWNFYEWSQGLDGAEVFEGRTYRADEDDALLNAFYALALDALANAEEGCGECAKPLRERLSALKAAYRAAYWTGTGYRLYADDANDAPELAQALAAYAGLSDERETQIVCGKLVSGAYGEACTLSHSIFKYDLLASRPEYRDWVFDELARVWGGMLRQGATSFWETIRGADDFENAGSLCHGWSAVPAYLYGRYKA